MAEKEIWKQIELEGVNSEVLVSSLGRVKHLTYMGGMGWHGGRKRMTSGKILNPSDNGNGYKYITLQMGDKRKHFYVHRLIAEAFLPKVPGKDYVNHIDYDRGNNALSNLEWCAVQENTRHSAPHIWHPRPNTKVGKYGRAIKKKKNRYEVNVYHAGKQIYCGMYKTVEEAEAARDAKYAELGIDYDAWR